MSGNIDGGAITLAVQIKGSSLSKALQDEVDRGFANCAPAAERLAQTVKRALAANDPVAIVQRSFDKLALQSSRGTMTEKMYNDLVKVEAQLRRINDLERVFLANKLQQSYILANPSASPAYAYQQHQQAQQYHVDRGYEEEQRQLAARSRETEQNRRFSNAVAHSNRDLRDEAMQAQGDAVYGAAKRARIEAHSRLDFADKLKELPPYLGAPFRTSEQEAINSVRSINDNSKRGWISNTFGTAEERRASREQGRRGDGGFGHRFRFATQNVAFGIDDAIQSYHYGGVGASIRAASNNLTAVAGMSISNPAIAAATVVGLSIGTAALPMILKRMGFADEKQIAAANYKYESKTNHQSALARGASGLSQFEEEVKGSMSALDEDALATEHYNKAYSHLKFYVKDPTKIPLGYSLMNTSGEEQARFDAADKVVQERAGKRMLTEEKFQLHSTAMDLLEKKTDFDRIERKNSSDVKSERTLSRATTVEAYEEELKRKAAEDISHLTGPTVEEETRLIKFRLKGQLSRKQAIQEEVTRNKNEAKWELEDLSSPAFGTAIGNLTRARVRQAEKWIADPTITGARYKELSDALDTTVNDRTSRAYFEETRTNRGNTSAFANATAAFVHRQEDYTKDPNLNPQTQRGLLESNRAGYSRLFYEELRTLRGDTDPLSNLHAAHNKRMEDFAEDTNLDPDSRRMLLNASSHGFGRQREHMLTAMLEENKVTNPLGALQDSFAEKAKNLQELIATGNLSPDEQATLSTNLKNNYIVSAREAGKPRGTEQFSADAMEVGGSADRNLFAALTGTYVKPANNAAEIQGKSLEQLVLMLKKLSDINEKLELARLGL